ncbi:MAG: response regulator transcription factor [Pseudomonadota bacterium]
MSRSILVVDDDPHIRDVIVYALEKADMTTRIARDGREAIEQVKQAEPDLIVLDINMPELDGLDVCREVRKSSDVPILFLSSRDDEIDRIIGLEIGGDDYVTKPFSPRELVARVNVILKRLKARAVPKKDPDNLTQTEVFERGRVSLDSLRHQVFWDAVPVALTPTEFAILKEFLRQPDRVFDRANLMARSYDANIHVSDRTIDSHIRHIRSKFADLGSSGLIETVHGVGYKLGPCT